MLYGLAGASCADMVEEIVPTGTPVRVLRCDTRADDHQRPLCGLARLLSWVDSYELARLSAADRRIVASVIFQGARSRRPPHIALVRTTVVRLVTVLVKTAPLVLVVQSTQWLDQASGDVLQYVARRVTGLPVSMLVTDDGLGNAPPLGYRICTRPLLIVFNDAVSVEGGEAASVA